AERLLEDDAAELAALLCHPGLAQPADNSGHELRSDGQVVQSIRLLGFVGAAPGLQVFEPAGGGGVPGGVVNAPGEALPRGLVPRRPRRRFRSRQQVLAELVVRPRRPCDADDAGILRQPALRRKVIQRRDELAGGEVTRGAEDDDCQGVFGWHWSESLGPW